MSVPAMPPCHTFKSCEASHARCTVIFVKEMPTLVGSFGNLVAQFAREDSNSYADVSVQYYDANLKALESNRWDTLTGLALIYREKIAARIGFYPYDDYVFVHQIQGGRDEEARTVLNKLRWERLLVTSLMMVARGQYKRILIADAAYNKWLPPEPPLPTMMDDLRESKFALRMRAGHARLRIRYDQTAQKLGFIHVPEQGVWVKDL